MPTPFPSLESFKETLPFPIHWVSDPETGERLRERILARQEPWGLDIETTLTGQHHCEVALVQISDGREAWLIDSLAFDYKPVIEALYASPLHVLIVHGGIGDLAVLKRVLGIMAENVFDTLVAAQVLAIPSPNLRELARECMMVRMTKGSQQSNWRVRPLTQGQFKYGALDAWVLPGIARVLGGRVAAAGKTPELRTGIKAMLDSVKAYQPPRAHPYEQGFAHRNRDKKARARLHALLDWRTLMANKGHIALLMSVGNRLLGTIAEKNPTNDAELKAAGFPSSLIRRYGERMLKVMASPGDVRE
ncbi:MAG: HRDC domain-containing protein [Planctomycetes bacterium]|nr:HRDC domain-containing protein [Planctomycetota bacterium]